MLSLLLFCAAERYNHNMAETDQNEMEASYFQQDENPCEKAMDYLASNRFANLPYAIHMADTQNVNPCKGNHSKPKNLIYLLSNIDKNQKQISKTNHPSIFYQHRFDMVDYYIYALRHIQI